MFNFFKRANKTQKKIYITIAVVLIVVCLLIEVLGRIPGIPFNGWDDVFVALGMRPSTIAPEGELQVHFIDVENADCILIRQGEHNMLIDAGDIGDEDAILDYLNRQGVEKFDLVVATHPHADHIGEMTTILENFPVERFIMSFMPEGEEPTTKVYLSMLELLDEKNIPIDEAEPGKTYTLGTSQFQILAPLEGDDDPNAMSVVTRLTFGDRSFLFTGDAEEGVERQILARGYTVKADVLKAGHHGSRTSTSDSFLRAVDPEIAVITCGEGNMYGHPHNETMIRLNKADITTYRADACGDIVITSDGTSLEVVTEKGG